MELFDRKVILKNVINDIVLMFTVFGDDFLPKIESYDVRNDINKLLDIYGLTLSLQNNWYLLKFNGIKYSLNYDFFKELIKNMASLEVQNLKEKSTSKKYHNYNKYQIQFLYSMI